jgi:hypothetical protein
VYFIQAACNLGEIDVFGRGLIRIKKTSVALAVVICDIAIVLVVFASIWYLKRN